MSIVVQHRRDSTVNVEANTPAAGELWMDTSKKELSIGDGALAGGIRIPKKNTGEILVAAQLVANTNDYSPAGLKHAGTLLISTDASRDITGLVATGVVDTVDGREITIYNAGAFNAVLKDQNVASTAANRFDLGGADITLQPKSSVTLRYRTQGALNRWEVKASTAGAAIADGGVIARKLASSAMGMSMINGTLVASVAGSALTVAVKTLAGADPSAADPVYVLVRNATPGTGDYTVMTLTAATSVVVSSGSSLGVAANNTSFAISAVGFNDAGVFRLGVINCLSGLNVYPLAAWTIATSTAEGGAGAADVTQTFYTGTAVAAKPYALLGRMVWETGLAAVGTWSAAPTRIQLYGPGVPTPGMVVQSARTDTGAMSTGSTAIPQDDTIPQNTEGDQTMSQAITPTSGANLCMVRAKQQFAVSALSTTATALFRDSTANALAVTAFAIGSGLETHSDLDYGFLFGSTTATTLKIRVGADSGTRTFNGVAGARSFGGVFNSFLELEEVMT